MWWIPGTFHPVEEENIEDHVMHSEYYSITPEAAAAVNRAKEEGTSYCRRRHDIGTDLGKSAAEKGRLKAGVETSYFHLSRIYFPDCRCSRDELSFARIDVTYAYQCPVR